MSPTKQANGNKGAKRRHWQGAETPSGGRMEKKTLLSESCILYQSPMLKDKTIL